MTPLINSMELLATTIEIVLEAKDIFKLRSKRVNLECVELA